MLQVDKQIAEIISARQRAMPGVENLVKQWEMVALDLDAVVAALGSVPEPLAHDPEILDLVSAARLDDPRQGIRSAITDLQEVTTRLASDTVNVGVSGQSIRCALRGHAKCGRRTGFPAPRRYFHHRFASGRDRGHAARYCWMLSPKRAAERGLEA